MALRATPRRTLFIAEKLPNAFGLFDVHGNVWEWCEDAWHENYYGGPPLDGSTSGKGGASCDLVRGGCFDVASNHSAAFRHGCEPAGRSVILGFRPARSLR